MIKNLLIFIQKVSIVIVYLITIFLINIDLISKPSNYLLINKYNDGLVFLNILLISLFFLPGIFLADIKTKYISSKSHLIRYLDIYSIIFIGLIIASTITLLLTRGGFTPNPSIIIILVVISITSYLLILIPNTLNAFGKYLRNLVTNLKSKFSNIISPLVKTMRKMKLPNHLTLQKLSIKDQIIISIIIGFTICLILGFLFSEVIYYDERAERVMYETEFQKNEFNYLIGSSVGLISGLLSYLILKHKSTNE